MQEEIEKLKAEVEKLKSERLAYKKLCAEMMSIIVCEVPENKKKNQRIVTVLQDWNELCWNKLEWSQNG